MGQLHKIILLRSTAATKPQIQTRLNALEISLKERLPYLGQVMTPSCF